MHSWNDDTTNQGTYAWLTEEDSSLRHPRGDARREIGGQTALIYLDTPGYHRDS